MKEFAAGMKSKRDEFERRYGSNPTKLTLNEIACCDLFGITQSQDKEHIIDFCKGTKTVEDIKNLFLSNNILSSVKIEVIKKQENEFTFTDECGKELAFSFNDLQVFKKGNSK